MSAGRLRVVMIALFVAAAILSALAEGENGPYLAGAFACFVAGVLLFFRWRRAQRDSVFAREEKTPAERPE